MPNTTQAPDNSHIVELFEKFSVTTKQLADIWGVTRSTVAAWRSGNRVCPKWTLIAAEAIRRRVAGNAERPATLVITGKSGDVEAVAGIARRYGLSAHLL